MENFFFKLLVFYSTLKKQVSKKTHNQFETWFNVITFFNFLFLKAITTTLSNAASLSSNSGRRIIPGAGVSVDVTLIETAVLILKILI